MHLKLVFLTFYDFEVQYLNLLRFDQQTKIDPTFQAV